MPLSKLEQETIILYNEAEPHAEVYTMDAKLMARLAGFARDYPDKVQQVDDNNYIVPKRMISLRKPMSEAFRAAARERARQSGRKPPARKND